MEATAPMTAIAAMAAVLRGSFLSLLLPSSSAAPSSCSEITVAVVGGPTGNGVDDSVGFADGIGAGTAVGRGAGIGVGTGDGLSSSTVPTTWKLPAGGRAKQRRVRMNRFQGLG